MGVTVALESEEVLSRGRVFHLGNLDYFISQQATHQVSLQTEESMTSLGS